MLKSPAARLSCIWLAIAVASLWLRTGFPIHAIATGGAWDDELFLRSARFLGAGEWLGPYDNLTLAKGMFYSLFILLASFAAVPLKLAEQGLYLLASALVAALVLRRSGSRRLATLLFTLLAFNPVFWSPPLARVIREGIYGSLALLVVALLVFVAFSGSRRDPQGKAGGGLWSRAWLGGLLGFAGGAFWITREEGIWLAPSVTVVLALALVAVLAERGTGLPRAARALRLAVPLLTAAAGFTAVNATVAGLNLSRYGVFETTEFKSGSFVRAYGALARINHAEWRRYVVFPADARQHAYAVSPAARELAPAFEGIIGEHWRRAGCNQMGIPAAACPEILSGWFMWALRDAAGLAGYHRSAPEAQAFYERLAGEINRACDAKRLECSPPRATLAPPFRWHYLQDALAPALDLTMLLLTLGNDPAGSAPSLGPHFGIAAFADAAGPVALPATQALRVRGWAAGRGGAPEVQVRSRGHEFTAASLARMPAEDVRSAYPDMVAVRFVLETDCRPTNCDMLVTASGSDSLALPLNRVTPGMVTETPDFRVFIEEVATFDITGISRRRSALQHDIAQVIGRGYAAIMPVAAGLGVAGTLIALFMLRPMPWALLGLVAASGSAIAVRIALLAYLDATSIPSAHLLYASPASPFVIVLAVVGSWLGLSALMLRRNKVGRPHSRAREAEHPLGS